MDKSVAAVKELVGTLTVADPHTDRSAARRTGFPLPAASFQLNTAPQTIHHGHSRGEGIIVDMASPGPRGEKMKNAVTAVLLLSALCLPTVAGAADAGETIGMVRTVSGGTPPHPGETSSRPTRG